MIGCTGPLSCFLVAFVGCYFLCSSQDISQSMSAGYGLKFAESHVRVDIGDCGENIWESLLTNMTIEFWIQWDRWEEISGTVMASGGHFSWKIHQLPYVAALNFIMIGHNDFDNCLWIPTPTLSLDRWYHYAVSYDGTTVIVYLDGLQVENRTCPFER